MSFEGRELNWEDQIENDGPEFVLLPEGEYDFEVTNFERKRYEGSDKLPPCNQAIVHIKLFGGDQLGSTTIKHNLYLHTITEGLLCAFFTSIGQRTHGQKVSMNWSKVVGSRGRAKVGIRNWKSDKGNECQSNEIKKFLEPATKPGFQAGKF